MLTELNARRSVKADMLDAPAPNDDELIEILQTGMSAPDHGAIRPWRFSILRGEQREELGRLFGEVLRKKDPNATDEMVEILSKKPLRGPLIVAIWAEITENHPKVPPVEQVVTTAMATENIMLAAQAKGYGAVLLTGSPAFNPHVQEKFGMSDKDEMIGFLYIGTPKETPRAMKRPNVADFLRPFRP